MVSRKGSSGENKRLIEADHQGIDTATASCELTFNAVVLVTVRRLLRNPEAPKLGPIRSLHYFVSVIEEVRSTPLSQSYLGYLRQKLAAHRRHSLTD
jgi:hypothetical protein